MRLPTKLLLMTLAGLLLIPFSARAELVLGACLQPTSLLKTVRAETYSKLTEVLWADSADFVLISNPETQEILYLKTQDVPPIFLPIQGTMMRWGE